MLIYVKKKKLFTDGRTDGRTTQNYSSEPHKSLIFNRLSNIKIQEAKLLVARNVPLYII